MAVTVTATTDAAEVLALAGPALGEEPARANQLLSLLQHRTEYPTAGRYWVACDDDRVVGVAFHSPAYMPVVLAPMEPAAALALAEHVAAEGGVIPGVRGEVVAAAAFAGRWTEVRGTGAAPDEGERLYELDGLAPPPPPAGVLRRATAADRDLLVDWTRQFHEDVNVLAAGEPGDRVDAYLAMGDGLWVWEGADGAPRAMASLTPAIAGVTRIGLVFTPADQRRQGYGGAVVAGASGYATGAGHRVILYTQLANPTSNGLYRRMGYRAVAEVLSYCFT
jgi:uncharacterized protein